MSSLRTLPRLERPDVVHALRDELLEAGYTVPRVCERVGRDSIYDAWGRPVAVQAPPDDALDVLIQLLLDSRAMPVRTARALLGDALWQRLGELDVVRSPDGETCRAGVMLYPTESLLVASDLPGFDYDPLPDDAVYPGITKNTRAFLASIPRTPCERFLELCAGSGIAALVAAPRAGHAWAADLTERCTHFARFNALLNGFDNFSAVAGDLYDPVAGQTFDRIAAHPPYVPTEKNSVIYRDGGEDGESITRRVIAEAPAYLAPGGVCYCTCVATDRVGAPLEMRLREWLGAASNDLDLMITVLTSWVPEERVGQLVSEGLLDSVEAEQRVAPLVALGIERQVYVSMAIRRHEGGRRSVTSRRQLGKKVTPAMLSRLVRWESELADRSQLPVVMGMQLRVTPDTTRQTVERLAGGAWEATARHLTRERPFMVRAEYDPAVSALLSRVDASGQHTVRDHWESMRRDQVIPVTIDEWTFASVVRSLAASGIVDTR
jgi:methylase of polypeptide subunit release factors